jgi:hypothetical protein
MDVLKVKKTHKLMIKTHNVTGLKYLCYTTTEGSTYDKYMGSGTIWKGHIKKHGEDITTELIFESTDYDEFKEEAIKKSEEYNIVESKEWANLRREEGTGGDTVSNKMWISKDGKSKYHLKDQPIPEGWVKGRANCIFNDHEKQKEFGSMSDPKKRGEKIKEAWDNGKFDKRDHSKCGTSGDDNPAKRPEVRKKISEAAKKDSEARSKRMKENKVWEYSHGSHKSKKE